MSSFQQKITRHVKRQENAHFEERKISLEPDLDITQMLEVSSGELKITIINMLSDVFEKVYNMQGWVM